MKTTFATLAATITRNAPTYATKKACSLMAARVRSAWEKAGAFGNVKDLLEEAIWAIRFRWAELDDVERQQRFDAFLAS